MNIKEREGRGRDLDGDNLISSIHILAVIGSKFS
jgi:hypothetical protein